MEAITKLIQSLGGTIFYLFAFIVSLFQTAASGEDYKVYTSEERIAFVSEQMENFNQIVEYAFAHTDEEKRIGSVLFDEFGKKEKKDLAEIEKVTREDIKVYRYDDNKWVNFKFRAGTPGFSESGVYYSENEKYFDPASGTEAVYDESVGKYVVFLQSSYMEITQIDEHYYFYETAFAIKEKDCFRRQGEELK